LAVVKKAKAAALPWVLILEDDAEPQDTTAERFNSLLPTLWDKRTEWDIFNGGPSLVKGSETTVISKDPPLLKTKGQAAHFYILHAAIYDKILTSVGEPNLQIIDLYYRENLRMWATVPYIAVQAPGHSSIEGKRVDHVKGLKESEGVLRSVLEGNVQAGGRRRRKTRRRNKRRSTRRLRQKGGADKCFFVNLAGGLGNRLYMYAAALAVNKVLKYPSICAISSANEHSTKDYLQLLTIQKVDSTPDMLARAEKADPVLPKPATFYSGWSESDIRIGDTTKDKKLIQDYYQSYPSIVKVIPEIKDMLYTKEFSKEKYKQYQVSPTAAFMHVRRGDYAKEGWLDADDYYLNALAELDKSSTITSVYVLSDDINWCKQQEENWKKTTKKVIECKDIPDELEALYLMSTCTGGAILSSSTFSSWGAYLGADMNLASVILYPKKNPITPGVSNPYGFPARWIGI
jgi:hypothetical protein